MARAGSGVGAPPGPRRGLGLLSCVTREAGRARSGGRTRLTSLESSVWLANRPQGQGPQRETSREALAGIRGGDGAGFGWWPEAVAFWKCFLGKTARIYCQARH